jgi:hypothetical protein
MNISNLHVIVHSGWYNKIPGWALVAHAVILAAQEAVIRRIAVPSQPQETV